jgi:uncharacterized membrane protein YhaH (DUF805 family)
MTAVKWYLEVLHKYAVFSGRARRKEYWLFVLFNILIAFALAIIDSATGLAKSGSIPLNSLYCLAVLVPSVAVAVRRLHDTGHSGWWWLIALVPLVGAVVLLIFMVQDSAPGQNQYGPNPKQAVARPAVV